MTALEIIRRKRDGERHTPDEIRFLVEGATRGTIPDYQLSAWLMAVRLRGMTDAETHELTLAMAASGRMLDLSSIPGRKVDKHSTGGVGDKATIVVAPMVAACGIPVAKLSGRALGHSGGTLDKLEAIPGMHVDLSIDTFIAQVRTVGIAIAGQTADIVPADKVFYALRDVTATVDSIPLIASSVMSKKLAAGADAIVLDVKAGRGAFVPSVDEAETLARALVEIGTTAGRQTVAYVTDMEQPLGRAVGNALEVREAIDTLAGRGPSDLEGLSLRLGAEMLALAGRSGSLESLESELRSAVQSGRGLRKFAEMIAAQHGDARVCDDPDRLPTAAVQVEVRAAIGGTVTAVDALEVAMAGKWLGTGRDRKEDPIDYAVGIVLHKKVGDAAVRGEPLATIHAPSRTSGEVAARRVSDAVVIGAPVPPRPLLLRRVTAAGVERLG